MHFSTPGGFPFSGTTKAGARFELDWLSLPFDQGRYAGLARAGLRKTGILRGTDSVANEISSFSSGDLRWINCGYASRRSL